MTPASSQPTILLAGYGYTLQEVAKRLAPGSFVATSRSADTVRGLIDKGCHAAVMDLDHVGSITSVFAQFPTIRKVVDSVPPARAGSPDRYASNLVAGAQKVDLDLIVFLSTTGVFGERDGAWVDETSTPRPWHSQGRARLLCEEVYRSSRFRSCSLRIPAIYGPGRGLEQSLRSGAYRLIDGGHSWSNRVHVMDLADVIQTVLQAPLDLLPEVLCINDDRPALQKEIVEAFCSRLDIPFPPSITAREAEERGSFTMLSNQRVSNARMKAILGKELQYPTYDRWLKELSSTA